MALAKLSVKNRKINKNYVKEIFERMFWFQLEFSLIIFDWTVYSINKQQHSQQKLHF